MDHASAAVLLFFSFHQWLSAELVQGLLARMTWGTGIYLVLLSSILSGTVALLVKYLIAARVLPLYKLVTGGLLALLASWYIDRICRNNTYLLVRSVGFGIIFCAVLGLIAVTGDGLGGKRAPAGTTVVAVADYGVAGD